MEQESGTFRDSVSIVSREGKRNWIYAKKPSGVYYRLRTICSAVLLLLLFGTPFIKINGHPFMLFNIVERKFILFGQAFGPHDFTLLGLAVITIIVFVILFTVVFGRLFCGWVCPQTVFMEMVFRRIEFWIEGDHRQQRLLKESAWNGKKITAKMSKYGIFFAISFLIANTLLSYIIGLEDLIHLVTDPPSLHVAGLTTILAFTVVFYRGFAWFREQACILVCPYGRLQGVLLDRNSIVVVYDHLRGEPREKLRRNVSRQRGDCIDCKQCVEVCPTGIDIRNGTQLECINCTACIDACDYVMQKVGKPKNLIRYDSATNISQRSGFSWTPRITGYSVLLAALLSLLIVLLARRSDIDVTVLRTPGMFYQEQPDGRISNVYDIKVLNKTFGKVLVTPRLENVPGDLQLIGNPLEPGPQGTAESKLLVLLPRDHIAAMSTPIEIGIYDGTTQLTTVGTSFLGPVTKH